MRSQNHTSTLPVCAAGLFFLCSQTAGAITPGATTPFITYEAEDSVNETNGIRVILTSPPTSNASSPELEASGHGYVELKGGGQSLTLTAKQAANAVVVRHSIPDAPQGGGIEATISLYVNHQKRQSLTLSSRHNWLYGDPGSNGQSNDPSAGPAHVFWDEARAFITGGVQAGDLLKIQIDEGDNAAFYRIDLVDLEMVPAPLSPPVAPMVSVVDAGADSTGKNDSTQAFLAAIAQAAAKMPPATVWVPAGTYQLAQKLELNGVKVAGAGMWYSNLLFPNVGPAGAPYAERKLTGFALIGNGAEVRDLYIENTGTTSRIPNYDYAIADNNATPGVTGSYWRLENVWIAHTHAGVWVRGTGGTVTGCRVRFTYADGINVNNGGSNMLIINNHVRGTGDDGLAVLSQSSEGTPVSRANIFSSNTVTATWWGFPLDLGGGDGHLVENNLITDATQNAGLAINLTTAYSMDALTGTVIQGNVVQRSGGRMGGDQRGAVWVYPGSGTVQGVSMIGNQVLAPLFAGLEIAGPERSDMLFTDNVIDGAASDAIVIEPAAIGSGTFSGNRVTRFNGGQPFVNSSSQYQALQVANTWNNIGLLVGQPRQAVFAGAAVAVPVSLQAQGESGPVTFSVSGLPAGVTAIFAPPNLPGPGDTVLTLATSATTPPGSYTLQIGASNGATRQTVDMILEVAQDFLVTVSPASATVVPGQSVVYTVTVSTSSSFTGRVWLRVNGLPARATGVFDQLSVVGPGTIKLNIEARDPKEGTYALDVSGSSGTSNHEASASLIVQAGASD